MTNRKFYKTKITFEVLSEEPIGDMEMSHIVHECMEGGFSGDTINSTETIMNGKQAAKALIKQGSDTEFFQLNEDGSDMWFPNFVDEREK